MQYSLFCPYISQKVGFIGCPKGSLINWGRRESANLAFSVNLFFKTGIYTKWSWCLILVKLYLFLLSKKDSFHDVQKKIRQLAWSNVHQLDYSKRLLANSSNFPHSLNFTISETSITSLKRMWEMLAVFNIASGCGH